MRRISIGDDPELLIEHLREEYETFAPDIIITSGGISHGKYEVVRNAIAMAPSLGLPIPLSWFGHVSQQPGGPQGAGQARLSHDAAQAPEGGVRHARHGGEDDGRP